MTFSKHFPARSPLLAVVAAIVALLVVALVPATALSAEPGQAASALVHDLEKIVGARMNTGWKIDRYELDSMMPDALQSVCATEESARADALAMKQKEIDELGGPIEEAYRKNKNSLSGLGELLAATRTRELLAAAIQRAPSECPFFIAPDPDFRGLQTDAHRFTLNLEGGGVFLLRYQGGQFLVGGGGLGRLLLGRGLNEHWTLLFGAELGGWALFQKNEGTIPVPIEIIGALPFVVRHVQQTWQYDMELAPVAFVTASDLRPSFGGRLGGAVGVSTLRIRRIMPWAGLQASVEAFPATSFRQSIIVLKAGARVGFDFDF